jgi:cell division protein ZapA
MAQVTIEVNGRPYVVGCEDGQEQHLRDLAKVFDVHVRNVSQEMGQLGDTRLLLMGALLLADELSDARTRLAAQQAEITRLQTTQSRTENRAILALESAAKRIERIAAQ